jgi:hypothetical protein
MSSETTPGSDEKPRPWQWMRRYRIWSANRKVFLYPENYAEPELRSEKSGLFEETESALRDPQDDEPERDED